MARVLVATPEPIGRRLAGPAIRASHIARVLSEHHEVTLVSLVGDSTSPIDGRRVRGPEAITSDYDCAVVQGGVTVAHPELIDSDMAIVVDWFDPFHVEALHRGGDDRILRADLIEGARNTLLGQARRGDFFLCSNAAQREHWLGWLGAVGRLNSHTHDDDPLFESLIAVAPFGVAPGRSGPGNPMLDTFSVIDAHDPILLWSGGLHDWLDPLVFIRAMPRVLDENPDARLVFLAGPHPNTSIEHMGIRGEAIALARDLRLFGSSVLFVNQWVDYAERLTWMGQATVGVVADRAHLESRYSHRSRLLDHLAVGLPTVSTTGDPLSTALEAAGAAVTADRTPEALGAALAALVNDDARLAQMSKAALTYAAELSWEQTLAPLIGWLESASISADRTAGYRFDAPSSPSPVDQITQRVRLHLDDGGPTQVVQRGFGALQRRLRR